MKQVISVLKLIVISFIATGGIFLGMLKKENDQLEKENEQKNKEINDAKELQERIIQRDNTSIDAKRSWLQKYIKNK